MEIMIKDWKSGSVGAAGGAVAAAMFTGSLPWAILAGMAGYLVGAGTVLGVRMLIGWLFVRM